MELSGSAAALPGQTYCFSCAFQLLPLQYLLPSPSGEVVLTLGRSREVEKVLQSKEREFPPFAVTLLLFLPSLGQCSAAEAAADGEAALALEALL